MKLASGTNGGSSRAGRVPLAARDLHVLLVVDSLDHGGAEAQVVGLAAALARLGHRPEIACSVEGALAPAARAAGIPVHSVMDDLVKRRASAAYGRELGTLLSTRGPFDLVHAHMFASLMAARDATQRLGIPLISTEHSEAKWRGSAEQVLSRRAFAAATNVIAVSEGIRRRLVEQDQVSPDKIQVIMNALAPRRNAMTTMTAAERVALTDEPLIGVIARLHPDKGIRHFLEAAALIGPRLADARFVVVGDGPEHAMLTDLAERLGVADRVTFLGYRQDATPVLRTMDVLVVPSISEGSPLIVLEGMQAGVPVVASAVGGIPEQITHGREGLLVPAGDPQAIAEAVVRICQTPGLGTTLAAAAIRRVAEYDHDAMVTLTEDVYFAALDRAGAPAAQTGAAASAAARRHRSDTAAGVKAG